MSWISTFTAHERNQTLFKALPVHGALRQYVRYYWVIKCGSEAPVTPELLVPDGLDEIIFSYDSHFMREVISLGRGAAFSTNGYIIGSKKYGLLCTRLSSLSMVGIKLQAGALHKMFNLPMNECRESPVSFDSLGEEALKTLEERIYESKSIEEIQGLLDSNLKILVADIAPPTVVDRAVQLLTVQNGNCTIAALSEKLNVSVRYLQKQFDSSIGVSPKGLAGILRFKKLYHDLSGANGQRTNGQRDSRSPNSDLGFYDQSHLIREFQKYIKMSPKKLFKPKPDLSTAMLNICLNQDSTP